MVSLERWLLTSLGERINIGGNVGYYNSDTEIDELEFEIGDGEMARRNVELRIIPVEFAASLFTDGT